ncbi:AAA family ATPase [Capnocytophaga bilenii]|mgnify:FL=1
MIQKIEKIKNIGNYQDYVASGDVTLKKINLIYAENGAGKTTLARILHSVSVNAPEIISNHKRINATTEPEVQIKDDKGGVLNFNANHWDRCESNIAVFDTHFVSENIYTGFYINSEHRKQLYKFVLGSIGVDIANKIERVKLIIDNINNEKSKLASQIKIHSKNQDVDKVCSLKPLQRIDYLIKEKKQELKIAQDNTVILKQSSLPLFPQFPFAVNPEEIKLALGFSVDGISKEYLDIVKHHLNKFDTKGSMGMEQWLYTGIQIITKDNKKECPFCGNNLDGIKLIEGYNQFFSNKYKESVSLTKNLKDLFATISIDQFIEQITSFKKQSENLEKFWTTYLVIKNQKPSIDYDVDKLKFCWNLLNKAIETKLANPLECISNDIVDGFFAELHCISEKKRVVDEYVTLYNTAISDLKNKTRKEEDIEKELIDLELHKTRFENPLNDLCLKYSIINHQLNRLQRINRVLQSKQKEESNQVFQLYGKKINYYLKDIFHTKFRISEIKDGGIIGRAKEASLNYTLTFNDIPIEQEGESNISFKNILSEGDKNTIAFSFFLAKINTKDDLSNQIIVFDDPLTSLDQNRRNATIHQLILLYQKSEQLIVLSHNLHFLIELNSISRIKKVDKKSLRIIKVNDASSISEYQIKKDWIDNYQKALQSMKLFLDCPSDENKEDAINSIRISLETFIKLKFCCFIPDPDQTFGTIVRNLQESDCKFNNSDKEYVIDKLNQLVSISWRGHHGSIEERDIYTDKDLTSEEAQNYVRMTYDLLYHDL